ncbi:MAG TPA: PQQ-binding-like beta-propeller repeat protein [Candidatus Binatia bacterium]|nr:PQQ-binding-like beta-propeller repeat protein [Candidatus Binatia bacterium]
MNKIPAIILSLSCLASFTKTLAGSPPAVLWIYHGASDSSPAIGPDGTIYLAGVGGLHAVAPNGTNKWIFPQDATSTAPAVAPDGTIYFGSHNSKFYAVSPDGSLKWSYTVDTNTLVYIDSSPALAPDRTIYFAAQASLFALAASGSKKWEVYIGDVRTSSPVIAPDGTIYVGSEEFHKLLALNPDGSQKWEFQAPSSVSLSPALGADGTIYFATASGGPLFAVSAAGAELWHNDGNFLYGSPSLGKDGTLYIGSARDLGLFAINSVGATNWEAAAAGSNPNMTAPTTAAIDASGMIYYTASNSLFALHPNGVTEWVFTAGTSSTSPTIGPDGTIYVGLGCCLYALQGTNKLASSAWPKFRQNLRNTGKVEKPSLRQPQKRSDGGFQFQLQGEFGQGYTVQGSTNLNTWTSLTSFVATTVPMDIVDSTATNFPVRFYRASSP